MMTILRKLAIIATIIFACVGLVACAGESKDNDETVDKQTTPAVTTTAESKTEEETTTTTTADSKAEPETEEESSTITTTADSTAEPETSEATTTEVTEPEPETTTEAVENSEPETTTAEPDDEEKYFSVEYCLEKLISDNYGKEIEHIIESETGALIVNTTDGDHVTVLIDMELYHSGELVNIDNFIVYDNYTIGYNRNLNP